MQKKKINYQVQALHTLNRVKESGIKPKLLLHVCCGPCTTSALEMLVPYFQVTLCFNNPNIFPKEEFDLRLNELQRFIREFEVITNQHVDVVVLPYDNVEFTTSHLSPLKDAEEGGERCHVCYEKRMDVAYQYAEDNGFDYFTTVLTSSRKKDSQIINEIGAKLALIHPKTEYFHSDFKKFGAQERREAMTKEYHLYSQTYCGCVYSYATKKE